MLITIRDLFPKTHTNEHTGTYVGDYPGLVAIGRSFSIPGVILVVRQNGRIVRESLYYDMEEVQRLLGLSPQ